MKTFGPFKFREAERANKWFLQLLFSYLPLFIIVLSLIFTSFMQSYSQRNRKELKTVSEYINQSIMQTIDNDLKSIFRQTSNELIVNNTIMRFFAGTQSGNELIDYEVMARLQDIKSTYPLIDSLYAVRFSDQKLVSEDLITDAPRHGDYSFIEAQEKEPFTTGWSSIRTPVSSEEAEPKPIISLIRKGNPLTKDAGMLVINLSIPTLRNIVEELGGTSYRYININDKYGQTIVGGAPSGEKQSKLTEAASPYTGWVYSINWMDNKAPFIYNTVPKLWVMVMVIAALGGLFGVVYLTYRNYRPVRAITSMIDEFTRKEFIRISNHADEMKYIETAMHTLIDKSLESQELFEADKLSKKLHYFRGLLEGSLSYPDIWQSELNPLNGIPFASRFRAILLEIDHYDGFLKEYSQRDQDLLKFVLRSMVQEALQEHRIVNWAEWTDSRRLTCVAAFPLEVNHEIYAGIVNWVQQNLRFSVTLGVGKEVGHAEEITRSVFSAERALHYKASLGINRVIEAEAVAGSPSVSLGRYYVRARTVAAALRVSRTEGLTKLQSLFEEINGNLVDTASVRQIVQYFLIQVEQEMYLMSEGYQNAWPEIRDTFSVDDTETVREAEETIRSMMDVLYSHIEQVRESRQHRIQLDLIKEYVSQNYVDPALSLDLLSSRFGLNAKYISKLFKDEFGINFMDFVINLRVEHACSLLSESDQSIQDIAELSGYTSSIAFRRTFKKITGMTPGEYRQRKSG